MDAARAEQLGIEPLRPTLEAIDRIETKADLIRTLAELQRVGVSGPLGSTSATTPSSRIETFSICGKPASDCRIAISIGTPS